MNLLKKYIIFVLFLITLTQPLFVNARTSEGKCETFDECSSDIDQYQKKYTETLNQKNTLSKELSILSTKIDILFVQITQNEITIKKLENEIATLTTQINGLDVDLNQLSSVFLSQISQNYKLEKRFPSIAFLFQSNFNIFLQQYKYLSTLQKINHDNLIKLETDRTLYDMQKATKQKKQNELENLRITLAAQKTSFDKQKLAKNNLLEATNNDEKKYQQLLTEAQNQLRLLKNFSSTAGGSSCLSSSPGTGSDGNFYSQRDPVWCKQLIGNSQDTLGSVGCYISSISMAFKKLGSNMTPSIYASDPLKFSLNTAYAKDPVPPSGYIFKSIGYDSKIVDSELMAGRYVIAQIRMSGSVSGMHFIVIISGSNGNYKIHDPWYGPDQNFSDHYSMSSIMSLRLITR